MLGVQYPEIQGSSKQHVLSLLSRPHTFGDTPWSGPMTRIFPPPPFRDLTPRIASPRRDLRFVPEKLWLKPRKNPRYSSVPSIPVAGAGGFAEHRTVVPPKPNFHTDANRRSDSTNRISSTRSRDPAQPRRRSGGGYSKMTQSCVQTSHRI